MQDQKFLLEYSVLTIIEFQFRKNPFSSFPFISLQFTACLLHAGRILHVVGSGWNKYNYKGFKTCFYMEFADPVDDERMGGS
jgi:hypothetical protein